MKKIIVADDDILIRAIIENFLSGLYHLELFEDGLDVVKWMSIGADVDLFIIDLGMPHLDGRELARKIRKQPNYEKVPVIIMSAADSPEKEAGLDDLDNIYYLPKPIQPRIFKDMIKKLLI